MTIRILAEPSLVWRAEKGGQPYMSRRGAYTQAARIAYSKKARCECGSYDEEGQPENHCDRCSFFASANCYGWNHRENRRNPITRLARWLLWRDKKLEGECGHPECRKGKMSFVAMDCLLSRRV